MEIRGLGTSIELQSNTSGEIYNYANEIVGPVIAGIKSDALPSDIAFRLEIAGRIIQRIFPFPTEGTAPQSIEESLNNRVADCLYISIIQGFIIYNNLPAELRARYSFTLSENTRTWYCITTWTHIALLITDTQTGVRYLINNITTPWCNTWDRDEKLVIIYGPESNPGGIRITIQEAESSIPIFKAIKESKWDEALEILDVYETKFKGSPIVTSGDIDLYRTMLKFRIRMKS